MKNDSKIEYADFCLSQVDIPLFYQPWYLDAMSGSDGWSVRLVTHDRKTIGAWPFQLKQKLGVKYITTPSLCPYLGPWLSIPENIEKAVSVNAFVKRAMYGLQSALPKSALTTSLGHPKFQNWLSLAWSGYHVETRYSFVIDLDQSTDELWSSIDSKQRNIIRKAESKYEVSKSKDASETIEFIWNSMAAIGAVSSLPKDIHARVKNADKELKERNARTIYQARNRKGKLCAAIYIVSDHTSEYLLLTGQAKDLEKRASGAVALLIWNALRDHASTPRSFDFEGGNLASIGNFFQSFGGTPLPYTRIWKAKNKAYEVLFRILNKV